MSGNRGWVIDYGSADGHTTAQSPTLDRFERLPCFRPKADMHRTLELIACDRKQER